MRVTSAAIVFVCVGVCVCATVSCKIYSATENVIIFYPSCELAVQIECDEIQRTVFCERTMVRHNRRVFFTSCT